MIVSCDGDADIGEGLMLRFEEAGEDELLLKAAELKSAQCEGGQVILDRNKGVSVY